MTMKYKIGQRLEVERQDAGIGPRVPRGPTWTSATVIGAHDNSYTVDVDGCGEGFVAIPRWLRLAPECTAVDAPAEDLADTTADSIVARLMFGREQRGAEEAFAETPTGVVAAMARAHLAKKYAAAMAEHIGVIPRDTKIEHLDCAPPPSNATCRCGAPSLALFSSTECSRGAECPIVASDPEPCYLGPVWRDQHGDQQWSEPDADDLAGGRVFERLWWASDGDQQHDGIHPTEAGAVTAWRAKVAAKPKVAIGGDLATGPDREIVGYALHDSVPDPTRPGHEMVTVQVGSYAAAQAHGDILRDLIWGVRR